MGELIEATDVEESARLVETGKHLLASLKETHARELELWRDAFEEVEFRQRWGDVDGMLEGWKGQLTDLDDDLLDSERELCEVKIEVAGVQKDHDALLMVQSEFERIKNGDIK